MHVSRALGDVMTYLSVCFNTVSKYITVSIIFYINTVIYLYYCQIQQIIDNTANNLVAHAK